MGEPAAGRGWCEQLAGCGGVGDVVVDVVTAAIGRLWVVGVVCVHGSIIMTAVRTDHR